MSRWIASRIAARPEGLLADPYYEWALVTDFAYHSKTRAEDVWLPVLLELRSPPECMATAQAFAEEVVRLQGLVADRPSWVANVRIPSFFLKPLPRLKQPLTFLAVLARPQFLADLYDGKAPADSVCRIEIGRAIQPAPELPPQPHPHPQPGLQGSVPPEVVTGVIDDGIAFAHDRFLSRDGDDGTTRIEYLWDQQLATGLPSGWGYGTELDKRSKPAGIDQRMADSRHAGQVDEDEVYRKTGHVDHARPGHKPLALRMAHGAHVMDLACNAGLKPHAGQRPIIAVQLPSATVEDTSGATLTPQVILGLLYILDRAAAVASQLQTGPLPVVVNLSYGMIAGPHDGASLLEWAMDWLIDNCDPPLRIVLPAGNNHLSRCHAHFSLDPGQSLTLQWRVLPDDWTESYLEIWLPAHADASQVRVTITAPDGSVSSAIAPGGVAQLKAGPAATDPVIGQAAFFPAQAVGLRSYIRVSLAPTGSPAATVPLAPAGLWQVLVTNAQQAHALCGIDAWIQRDDTAPGYRRRGRQLYFDDADYRRFDDGGRAEEADSNVGYVKREGALNAIATGQRTIVVGGFRRSDGKPVPMSASGPVVAPGRGAPNPDGPDAMLPGDDAPSLRGVLAAGTRSGSCVAMQGTSVAAPQAALLIAERLAGKLSDNRQFVFDAAAAQDPAVPPKSGPKRGGGGRLPRSSSRRPRREI